MKILIVDDHQIFRVALIQLLKSIHANSNVYEEAANGREALEKLKASRFDLMLLDVSMPIMDGSEACKLIRQDYPALPIIMLTQLDDQHLINHFYNMGVQSFIRKGSCTSELISAINCALKGERFFSAEIMLNIENGKNQETPRCELNLQEKKLIHLLHKGITSKEIAHLVGLTTKTVHTYRERLLRKTNTANSVELISFGFRTGILIVASQAFKTLDTTVDVGKI